jgi:hypothetical protein
MMTVRFPSGFSVQYNTAMYSWCEDGRVKLYTDSTKLHIVAIVSGDAIVEHISPCRTYDASIPEVAELRREIRALTRKLSKNGAK